MRRYGATYCGINGNGLRQSRDYAQAELENLLASSNFSLTEDERCVFIGTNQNLVAISTDQRFENQTEQNRFDSSSFLWCSSMRLYCRLLLYFGAFASVFFLLYATFSRDSAFSNFDGKSYPKSKQKYYKNEEPVVVKLEVYMESQCPDTTKFINSQLVPVFDELHDYIDLKMIPFGKAKWKKLEGPDEDYSFQCQHGPRECAVNQLMCCGIDRLKTAEKYLPYVACLQGTSPGGREQEQCDKTAGLPHKEMQDCGNGREGRLLHHEMGELTKALDPPLFFIPWILVDGTRDKRALTNLKAVVCGKLKNSGVVPPPCAVMILIPIGSTTLASLRLKKDE